MRRCLFHVPAIFCNDDADKASNILIHQLMGILRYARHVSPLELRDSRFEAVASPRELTIAIASCIPLTFSRPPIHTGTYVVRSAQTFFEYVQDKANLSHQPAADDSQHLHSSLVTKPTLSASSTPASSPQQSNKAMPARKASATAEKRSDHAGNWTTAERDVGLQDESKNRKYRDADDMVDTPNEYNPSPRKSKKRKRVDTDVEIGKHVNEIEAPKKRAEKKSKTDIEVTAGETADQNNTRKKKIMRTSKHSETHIGPIVAEKHDQRKSRSSEPPSDNSGSHSSTELSRTFKGIQSEAGQTRNVQSKQDKRGASVNVRDAENSSDDGSTFNFNRELPREHGFPTSGKRMLPTAEKARARGGDIRSVGIKTKGIDVVDVSSDSESESEAAIATTLARSAQGQRINPHVVLQQMFDEQTLEIADLHSILRDLDVSRAEVFEIRTRKRMGRSTHRAVQEVLVGKKKHVATKTLQELRRP